MSRSRRSLHIEAAFWRALVGLGMWLHRRGPRSPRPSKKIRIPSTLSSTPGHITSCFYTPKDYVESKVVGSETKRYPILFSFHNSGASVGSAIEDGRWAEFVVERTGAVVCAVDYRLAPEHPYPIPVEDGCDAVLYVYNHAEELSIDKEKIGLSGFSTGGNMSFTIPYMLDDLRRKQDTAVPSISCIVSFYPDVDHTKSREDRNRTNPKPQKEPPMILKRFFDQSFIHQSDALEDLESPYLSPGLASDELITRALPQDICLFTCEYDGLRAEGERFRTRLKENGKNVEGGTIEGEQHGYDRMPFGLYSSAQKVYGQACDFISRSLNGSS